MNSQYRYIIKKYSKNINRLLLTFLDNYLVFICRKKAIRGPLAVVWDIVEKCNMKCVFCNWWREDDSGPSPRGEGLSFEERSRIIEKLADAGVWMLSFCGGEALLCEDLDRLATEAKERGMLVSISTNGLLLEEKADMLVNAGIDFITVSIDSHLSEVHDALRGHEGLFHGVEKGLRRVREISAGRKGPYLEARCLINRKNYTGLNEYVSYWRDKVDGIIFKPIYDNPNVFFDVPAGLAFHRDDEDEFRRCFSLFLRTNREFDTEYMRRIPDFLFEPERLEKKFVCFAGTFFASIDAMGELRPCSELSLCSNNSLGNLLNVDLMELWNSPDMCRVRSMFRQGERCKCWMDKTAPCISVQKILPRKKYNI